MATLVSAASAASTPSEIGFAICPNVTDTTYPGGAVGPGAGCGPPVFSAGSIVINPDNTCTTPTNSDLGTFLTDQNPLGAFVGVHGPNNCTTTPPTRGAGVGEGGAVSLSVTQRGFCPTILTITARTGPFGSVLFPIGTLPLGTYAVAATFPDQTVSDPRTQPPPSWIGSRANGTLHVGARFTETEMIVGVRPGGSGTLAALVSNSVAGRGAARIVSSRGANPSTFGLRGTDYYACGTIDVAALVRLGKRRIHGIARLTGNGRITGGTGNYIDLTGTFKLTGTHNARTNITTVVLRGVATYQGGSTSALLAFAPAVA